MKEKAGELAEKCGTARLLGSREDAEQEYVLKLLESSRYHHLPVSIAVIDMARPILGKKGTPKYEKAKALAHAMPTDPEQIRGATRPFDIVNRRLFLERSMDRLNKQQRVVMLMFLDGLTFDEIADTLNLTTSRVNQIWHKSVEIMKEVSK